MNPELLRRIETMRQSTTGAVLCEYFASELAEVKTALCSATPEQVLKLQGQAAAYLKAIKQFTKQRE